MNRPEISSSAKPGPTIGTEVRYSERQEYAFQQYVRGNNIFITGEGGTGKTKLIPRIYQHATTVSGKNIQVCAMTGCAAVLLKSKAKTIHSWAGIGLAKESITVIIDKLAKRKDVVGRWKKVDILVIDEVSMLSAKLFELLDALGRRIRRNRTKPFGGIQLVFSGDFFQLPPVFRAGIDESTCGQFCFETELWNQCFIPARQIPLVDNFRQTDQLFCDILREVRRGYLSPQHVEILSEKVGRTVNPELGITPTQLYPLNASVSDVNSRRMMELAEPTYTYEVEYVDNLDLGGRNRELLAKMGKSMDEWGAVFEGLVRNCPCERVLKLKLGAQVMHTINVRSVADDSLEICNGEQGVVVGFARASSRVVSNSSDGSKTVNKNPFAEFCLSPSDGGYDFPGSGDDSGSGSGSKIGIGMVEMRDYPVVRFANGITRTIYPNVWMSDDIEGMGIRQLPLILSWAVSIHKCQGMTMSMAEIDLGRNVFEYAQSYVGLSRVRNLDGLFLKSFDPSRIRADPRATAFYAALDLFWDDFDMWSVIPRPASPGTCDARSRILSEEVDTPSDHNHDPDVKNIWI
jgi:ATP-dependent DNA helicase PIF1